MKRGFYDKLDMRILEALNSFAGHGMTAMHISQHSRVSRLAKVTNRRAGFGPHSWRALVYRRVRALSRAKKIRNFNPHANTSCRWYLAEPTAK